jgi:signal transduction histidine kinase
MVDLARETEDPALIRRALAMSADAASRVGHITQSLLALAGPESGAPACADLADELRQFAAATQPALRRKGIALVLDLQAACAVSVPHNRFAQALQHLLKNSEEALAEAAARGAPTARPTITIHTQSQTNQVLLRFADTGVGIAPENLAQVFDPFFTTKGVLAGGNTTNAGLGLTLVRALALELGGHTWAESEPGQGTTINLLMPSAG